MGGGDWDKDQNSVNLMPDPALSAENRIYNAKLKAINRITTFSRANFRQ